jgi:hypothetical protein
MLYIDMSDIIPLSTPLLSMNTPQFGSANFYSLVKPVEVRIVSTSPDDVKKPSVVESQGQSPLVVITGRGTTVGRVANLLRLRPKVVKDIKSLVDGPLYLTVELALEHYAEHLRSRPQGSVEMVKAESLE